MAQHVYTTSSTDLAYRKYSDPVKGSLPRVLREITIRGGANVADKHFITPCGVGTEVTDDDVEFLRADPNFQRHEKAGFVMIVGRKLDPEVPVADMEQRDRSAPKRPADFEKPPKVDTVTA